MGCNYFPGTMGPKPRVTPSGQGQPPFRGPQTVRDPRTVAKTDLTLSDVLLFEAVFGSEDPTT